MKIDSREFSQVAHKALGEIKNELDPKYHKKASGLIQGLTTYISTWGLHRLSGDAKKFLNGTAEDTQYKGKVYQKFLVKLQEFSKEDFDPEDEGSLIHLPLPQYTSLNRLAIQLSKEWSFWAASVLGEAEQ
ncbi:MAG: hypothetical protein SAL07_22845 [Oscillatoria sp. PMC 1051.18]|nr:hypothetical protein [Oscillatoria sp. PMC 1050.18]MEC5032749.1 hypothetical protein [Oscillatoria sp. PMC 1051.18]